GALYKKVNGVVTLLLSVDTGVTNVTSKLKIKVTRSSAGLFSLYVDQTATGTAYLLSGTVSDNTLLTGNYFGILIKQSTASFFQKHFFDDILIGGIVVDNTPPQIVSVTATAINTLDIKFNETVALTSSQINNNYNVNNSINQPSSAIRDAIDNSLVHLAFLNSFQNGITYTITVSNVQDLSNNSITTAQQNFSFYQPLPGDVVINEIMADPDPAVALPNVEYIELYNTTTNIIDLSNWTFTDGTANGTFPAYQLQPNEHLIVCATANVSLFSSFGNATGISSMPSLNNSGDNLFLKDENGIVISKVFYNDTWYQDAVKKLGGWSLEQIDPNSACSGFNNWIASNDINGGTPGTQNSVFASNPDLTPPTLLAVGIINTDTLLLTFSETLDSATAANIRLYAIDNGISISNAIVIAPEFQQVKIVLTNNLVADIIYTITAQNISDCSGNIQTTIQSQQFGLPVSANVGDIVINEIMADPDPVVALPSAEYIELYNTTTNIIDISNWIITDGSSDGIIGSFLMQPQSYLILCATANVAALSNYGNVIGVTAIPSLNNAGDNLLLKDANGNIISKVFYNDTWYKDAVKKDGGWSLEQIDPSSPCSGFNNWIASNNANGGTPGTQNSVLASNPDTIAPALISVGIINADTILLTFNETVDSATAANINHYAVNNGISISAAIPIAPQFQEIKIVFDTSIIANIIYTITVDSLSDCSGNIQTTIQSLQFALPDSIKKGDLIINEILYNPKSFGYDYLEIYNNSNKVLDLKDLKIANLDATGAIGTISQTDFSRIIFPHKYVLISEDTAWVKRNYFSSNDTAFVESDLPSFNDDEGTVLLLNNEEEQIDSLQYSAKWQFKLISIKDGVSLERISFDAATQDSSNWHSAAAEAGYGTPGIINSQIY
ncbi:MAG: lamin tail domain-containing protein, partial [Pseudomonadota bacterium]